MNDGWVTGAAFTAVGGVVTWLGNLLWQRRVHRDEIQDRKLGREALIEHHTSSLAVELLKIANSEAGLLRQKIAELELVVGEQPELRRRAAQFDEAMYHLQQLVDADDGIGRNAAETHARDFIARVNVLNNVKGIAANREQTKRAARKRIEGRTDDA